MKLEIWTEKYRPKTLKEVVNQKHIVSRLEAWVKKGSIPHMLFAGPAGVGKTTVALCLAYEFFGKEWRTNFQEMNASDERGINIVRGRIKDFARVRPIGADFKIIFLDESDALTPEAQQALRRTIERFSNTCRFILSCNYSSKIIEPIQSRTSVFRFKRMNEENVDEYVKRIAKGEKLNVSKDATKAIYEISEGDLRQAANLLQASSALGKVRKETIYEAAAQSKPEDIKEMMDFALKGKFSDARKKLFDLLITQGLSGEDIIKGIHKEVFNLKIQEDKKIRLVEQIGEFEYRMNQGGSPEIQLEALLAQFMKHGK
ncbi:MAG: replication factor C small subunit [Candidatus Aenigmarchaeota archaeon]|nr:replication factor C small subunit [Candidatus Aenigmarchaeota archaeon]NIQ17249.1 replication factor C small subunit [Candidatus Aenigmarchaeota archaeon]NIS73057.1 replication factor C small subunit [Candidatus Aenigmarchaeota archaeon]